MVTRRDAVDMGLRFARGFPGQASPVQPPAVGFTAPTVTYDKMRQIQAFAESLDLQVPSVADPVFRSAWNAWYEHAWSPFFDKYAGPNASTAARLGAAFSSDDLARQTESYRRQLESFASDFERQKQTSGQPVADLPGSAPDAAKPTDAQLTPSLRSTGLPWWFWVGSGVALVGVGYLLYRRFSGPSSSRDARDEPRALERVVYLRDVPVPVLPAARPAEPPEPRTFRDYVEQGPTRSETTLPILAPSKSWL